METPSMVNTKKRSPQRLRDHREGTDRTQAENRQDTGFSEETK
jgi:hypothetical protein